MSAPAPIDHRKAARRGPVPLPVGELRTYTVSVRLNGAELAALDERRSLVRMLRGEWLRAASLHRMNPSIPSINVTAWQSLARASGNLNSISKRLAEAALGFEAGTPTPAEIGKALAEFRGALIGAQLNGETEP